MSIHNWLPVDIGIAGVGCGRDLLAGRRIEDRTGFVGFRLDPLAADEQSWPPGEERSYGARRRWLIGDCDAHCDIPLKIANRIRLPTH
jgi:hypothetical protein